MINLQNTAGKIWYGLHMYPGVAQYQEPDRKLMVFVNESTLRQMDPTFAGRPVFVMHVDGVERSIDKLRAEADGWVIESFFNEADGKHWVKFITCSKLAEKAIEDQGMRLSNCYAAKGMGPEGKWNGVPYDAQVTTGEYEHLALVPNPRYEESVIMTPDQFKSYNERQREELKRLSNQGDSSMLKLWNRSAAADSDKVAGLFVTLKSGRELTVTQLVNEADEKEAKEKEKMANEDHHVQVGEEKMSVGDLKKKYQDMCNELTELKAKHVDGDKDEGDDKKKNAADEAAAAEAAKKLEDAEAEVKRLKNESDARKAEDDRKKARDKAAADVLRNAVDNKGVVQPVVVIDLPMDRVERGQKRYG